MKRLLAELKEYKAPSIKAPLFMIGEVGLELSLPFLMAYIIDNGVTKGDMKTVVIMGLLMLAVAFLSLICGAITLIAVCALIALAAFLTLPTAARIALVALALITVTAGVGAAAMLDARAGCFQCPHCRATFTPTLGEYVKAYHTFTRRRLVCPTCGKTGMCRRRIAR